MTRPKEAVLLLRDAEVAALLGIARSTLWAWVKEGGFPSPVRLAANTVRWPRSEVEAGVAEKAAVRESA